MFTLRWTQKTDMLQKQHQRLVLERNNQRASEKQDSNSQISWGLACIYSCSYQKKNWSQFKNYFVTSVKSKEKQLLSISGRKAWCKNKEQISISVNLSIDFHPIQGSLFFTISVNKIANIN